jgi:endoglucanase
MTCRLPPFAALVLLTASASAQSNPVKVATVARFDLLGDAGVGALTNGYMTAGDGSVARQSWITNTDQPRSFTVSFTVPHFDWSPAGFRFTPASNGTVSMTLRGPWELSPTNSLIYKQEVLWDACSASNTTLTNGGFESVNGGLPVGWWRTYGTDAAVDTGPVTPAEGSRYLRVWHDGPMSCSFTVTGGVPVALSFYARAVFPTNFPEMQRVAGTNTSAHLAALKFMRGVNTGNYLEAPPGQDWGSHYTTNDFIAIRSQGFDHVRIPGGWNFYVGPAPDYTVSNSYYIKEDFLVTNALNQGLAVIINIHNWAEFGTNALANTNEFYAIWRQIAAHYSNSPPEVAFELLNEPSGAGSTTEILNPIYAEAIRQIRLTNPTRTIFVGPSQWNGIGELNSLRLPDDDTNLIVTVHCYDPFYFTHQGASWGGPDVATVGLIFPGPPATPLTPAAGISTWATNWITDYNTLPTEGNPSSPLAFRAKLQFASQWSAYYGRPVHVGEFGCYTNAEPVSRARFYAEIRSAMDAFGLGWAMWDWNALFRYWNPNLNHPMYGMEAAMFPAPRLTTTGPGQVGLSAAIAKTYRLDRAWLLGPPLNWQPLQTNTLADPNWFYTDALAGVSNAAFYRAVWLKLAAP